MPFLGFGRVPIIIMELPTGIMQNNIIRLQHLAATTRGSLGGFWFKMQNSTLQSHLGFLSCSSLSSALYLDALFVHHLTLISLKGIVVCVLPWWRRTPLTPCRVGWAKKCARDFRAFSSFTYPLSPAYNFALYRLQRTTRLSFYASSRGSHITRHWDIQSSHKHPSKKRTPVKRKCVNITPSGSSSELFLRVVVCCWCYGNL